MTNSNFSWSLVLISMLAIWGLVVVGCQRPESGSNGSPSPEEAFAALQPDTQPVAVEAMVISSGQFFDAISVSGTVRGTREVTIVSGTNGVVAQVLVGLGERVRANQLLVLLDNDVERYAVAQARDNLEVANLELKATQELIAGGSSSPAELARITANASGARSILAQAQDQLDNKVIRAPISGEVAVLSADISLGNFISLGNTIARVVDLRRLRMDVGVGERDILLIDPGAAASVKLAACGEVEQPARVSNIAAGSASNDGNFIVVVEWDNRCQGVKSGMSATVRIAPSTNEASAQTIVVPTAAILRRNNQDYLYLVVREGENSVAQQVEIEVGKRLGNRTEIISGVNEGDLLIIAPLQSLDEGSLVEPTSIGSTATIR